MSAEAERIPIEPERQRSSDDTTLSWFSWKKTSMSLLATCEEKILSFLSIKPEGRYVPIFNGTRKIWTISLNTRAAGTPLVLLHGMGSGVALWVLNLDSLARSRPVYAIDLLGFGRSTRSKFSTDASEVEAEYVKSIEEWRSAMNIDKMVLLGHSLGGYLAASYALRHADRVKHLILADPWGFPPRPSTQEAMVKLPLWAKVARTVLEPLNPFAVLRAAGPWGPGLVIKFRSDIIRKYSQAFTDERIGEYMYHCNAQPPSGEAAFKSLVHEFGWAKHPMIDRIHEIPAELSMTLIYGSRSWVDYGLGYQVKYKRPDSYVNVEVIRESGHHVYADKPEVFNSLVNKACDLVERYPQPLKPELSSSEIPAELQRNSKILRNGYKFDAEENLQPRSSKSKVKVDGTEEDEEDDIMQGGR